MCTVIGLILLDVGVVSCLRDLLYFPNTTGLDFEELKKFFINYFSPKGFGLKFRSLSRSNHLHPYITLTRLVG